MINFVNFKKRSLLILIYYKYYWLSLEGTPITRGLGVHEECMPSLASPCPESNEHLMVYARVPYNIQWSLHNLPEFVFTNISCFRSCAHEQYFCRLFSTINHWRNGVGLWYRVQQRGGIMVLMQEANLAVFRICNFVKHRVKVWKGDIWGKTASPKPQKKRTVLDENLKQLKHQPWRLQLCFQLAVVSSSTPEWQKEPTLNTQLYLFLSKPSQPEPLSCRKNGEARHKTYLS